MIRSITFILTLLLFIACEEEKLEQLRAIQTVQFSQVEATVCQPPDTDTAALTYFVYIVDTSSSNGASAADGGGSDPGQDRFLTMADFAEEHSQEDGTEDNRFMLITFADVSDVKIDWSSAGEFAFQLQRTPINDIGFSNIPAGLDQARSQIIGLADSLDFQARKNPKLRIKFVVNLLTDGLFNIGADSPSGLEANTPVWTATQELYDLQFDDSLLAVESIQVNALYYYGSPMNPDGVANPDVEVMMREVARIGEGKYINFGTNLVDYSLFASPQALMSKTLTNIMVRPMNVSWDPITKDLQRDTDGDGLADRYERELGSDPNNNDSDGNGVPDMAEFLTTGKICQNEGCAQNNDINPLCVGFVREDDDVGTGIFKDSDGDGIDGDYNDCVEALLQSNRNTADTNGNFLLDLDEYNLGLNPAQKTDHTVDSDGDGITDAREIQIGSPHMIHNKDIITENYVPMSYHLRPIKEEDGTNCYQLTVDDAPYVGGDNKLSITFSYADPMLTTKTYHYRAIVPYVINDKITVGTDAFKEIKAPEDPDLAGP
jgi:hypothetical protein